MILAAHVASIVLMPGSSSHHRARRQDTNILAVKFSTLAEPGHIHTGDAQVCSNKKCGAIVSHLSTILGEDDDKVSAWLAAN